MGSTFFTLPPQYKIQLHEEIFNLCYYSQGAFTQDVVYNLPVYLRRFYIRKLVDVRTKENEDVKKAQQEAKSSSKKPARPPTGAGKRSYR